MQKATLIAPPTSQRSEPKRDQWTLKVLRDRAEGMKYPIPPLEVALLQGRTRFGRGRRTLAVAIAGAALITLLPTPALAFKAKEFGPAIDTIQYDGQSKCQPVPKPGVLAFQSMVLKQYPLFGIGGISRACNVGGQSEHKEGRAWDMTANAAYESHRKAVQQLFDELLATDEYGNEAALARRFGIMYIIWNRKIWGSWGGWSTYCVDKPRGCVDPDDKDLRHPHTDHVHFSFTWAGARQQTTWYSPQRSFVTGAAAHPEWGYWLAGGNGSVSTFDTYWHGSKADTALSKPVVAMASTIEGDGYWLVTKSGRVFPFGDAANRGYIKDKRLEVVDIEVSPSGNGYWLLARSGRVFPFGDAPDLGGAKESGSTFAGMAATSTGLGYWLFGTGGNVFAFGDAQDFGGLADEDLAVPVVGGDNVGDSGYWLATERGRVEAFGSATRWGDATGKAIQGSVVEIMTAPEGTGYWLVTSMGRVLSFGEAGAFGSMTGTSVIQQSHAVTRALTSILGDEHLDHDHYIHKSERSERHVRRSEPHDQ